ncbi:nitroreductase family deazaflavin-dependent oxidoreductase [Mycolicibacter longobardus]|uniref:Nitroreductase n=1 Tax=Mycolicibacter longobardus TaxID=1108812 RepID=A0A1X1YGD0_9MYCO|nr:nitroreductase family deazaflavin-dependent oxidoreductase [Mycolicibacter longobardus]ORW10070.1 nitroreductase [Mycolicibacter longobardus]
MPFSKRLARWNRVGLNRITRHIASWAPGFGVIRHQGRRSGRVYETPVNVFMTATGVRVALTYGADADWVKNVLVAGGCRLRTRSRELTLTEPRVVHDPARRGVRRLESRVLGVVDVADFIDFTAQPAFS